MANHDAAAPDATRDPTRDHKGLIYAIAGSVLAIGLLLMAFYDRGGDPMPIASVQHPVVTAQR